MNTVANVIVVLSLVNFTSTCKTNVVSTIVVSVLLLFQPKPKSKKQLQAEQRRREKEMAEIAAQLEEKAKLDEERAEQRKQVRSICAL